MAMRNNNKDRLINDLSVYLHNPSICSGHTHDPEWYSNIADFIIAELIRERRAAQIEVLREVIEQGEASSAGVTSRAMNKLAELKGGVS
jgi:hypothetical protein